MKYPDYMKFAKQVFLPMNGWVLMIYLALFIVMAQFAVPELLDHDSYYHVRYANTLPERGFSRSFEWTEFSLWKDNFSDKELLFHIVLIPFCAFSDDLVLGGKLAVIFLNLMILLSLLYILKKNRVVLAPIWALLFFSAGSYFLIRLNSVRPHLLSILITLWATHFIINQKHKPVLFLGFIYAWTYAAPHFIIAIAALAAIAGFVHDGRFSYKCILTAAVGVLAGMVIHPYFPNNIYLWFVQSVLVLFYAWGGGGEMSLRLGDEFYSYTTRNFALNAAGAVTMFFAAMALIAAAVSRPAPEGSPHRISRKSVQLMFLAFFSLALFFMSPRFIEYFAPFMLLCLAFMFSDLAESGFFSRFLDSLRREHAMTMFAVVAVGIVTIHGYSLTRYIGFAGKFPTPQLEGSANWIKKNVPPGELVANLDWSDLSQLYYYDRDHRYLNGLDPTFMFVGHRRQSDFIWKLYSDPDFALSGSADDIKNMFGADWVVTRKRGPIYEKLRDTWLDPVWEDKTSAVYKLSK